MRRLRLCGGGCNEQDAQLVLHTASRLFDRPLDGLFDLGESMKPIAWYDPTNGMVSTDKDSPLFTPLGQVWPLFLEEQQITADCPNCEYHRQRAQRWRDEAYKQAGHPLPERGWVGLTDEDFVEACQMAERGNYLVAFQHIQAKLKDKNVQR